MKMLDNKELTGEEYARAMWNLTYFDWRKHLVEELKSAPDLTKDSFKSFLNRYENNMNNELIKKIENDSK